MNYYFLFVLTGCIISYSLLMGYGFGAYMVVREFPLYVICFGGILFVVQELYLKYIMKEDKNGEAKLP